MNMGIKRTSCNSDYFLFECESVSWGYPLFSCSFTTYTLLCQLSFSAQAKTYLQESCISICHYRLHATFWDNWHQGSVTSETDAATVLKINNKNTQLVLTFAFSMTFANSPTHKKQKCGVNNRKQSPLFSDEALGSTNLVWTCLLPKEKTKLIIFLWLLLSNAKI